jgi:hypothetical protein
MHYVYIFVSHEAAGVPALGHGLAAEAATDADLFLVKMPLF